MSASSAPQYAAQAAPVLGVDVPASPLPPGTVGAAASAAPSPQHGLGPAADEGDDAGRLDAGGPPSALVGYRTPTWDERIVATSSVSAEAEQGDGPAAASASASAVGSTPDTKAVSVVVGPHGAAAACPFGAVAVGADGAAAASQVGVAAVGPNGASSACNSANSSRAVVRGSLDASASDPR